MDRATPALLATLWVILFLLALALATATERQLCPRCRRAFDGRACPACRYAVNRSPTKEIRHAHRER
jgi:hypothetical protein